MKLLDVIDRFKEIDSRLESSAGEVTPEIEAIQSEVIKWMEENEEEACDGVCCLIKHLETRVAGLKEREEIFRADRKATEGRSEFWRNVIKEYGLRSGQLTCSEEVEGQKKKKPGNKIETAPHGFKISVQYAGKAKLVIDEDFPDVPEEFLTYLPPIINKEAVVKALDEGQDLPFAHYEERTKSLVIK